MNIKSLLIGSAALMTVSPGAAYAADAIVMAEPEPVEYVRVCDVYGAGFFYIPGTETCLKIGGRMRMQVNFATPGYTTYNGDTHFMLNMDARSETEWGTLRGFGEVEIAVTGAYALTHAFIELSTGTGTLRIGRSDSPYARFLGYGASGFNSSGSYGFNRTQEISYTFAGSNGFSAIIALLDNVGSATWATDVEGGIKFEQGWGSIGAIAGYDSVFATWGAKGVARFRAPNSGFDASLHVFYASGPGQYNVTNAAFANVMTNWSVLGNVGFALSSKAHIGTWAQWYDDGTWRFAANVGLTPVSGLLIRPEIQYSTGGGGIWAGTLRFERSF